jgi:hypothetical protein
MNGIEWTNVKLYMDVVVVTEFPVGRIWVVVFSLTEFSSERIVWVDENGSGRILDWNFKEALMFKKWIKLEVLIVPTTYCIRLRSLKEFHIELLLLEIITHLADVCTHTHKIWCYM